jgi:hypothetical protein
MLSRRNQYRAGRALADCEPCQMSSGIFDPGEEQDDSEQDQQMASVCEHI